MQFNTDFKLAGPLAGLFGGITQAQDQERQGLSNAYQMLKNQEQEYTSAEAQAKMQDPRYIQMKLQNDISKFGKDMEMNKLEQGYNATTRALTDLKIASAQGPQVLQQKALGYMKELGIDPNSQQGQMMLQDPVGFAEKTQQFYASAATQNADYQQKFGLQKQKGDQEMDKQRLANEGSLAAHQVSANATRYAADVGAKNKDQAQLLGVMKDTGDKVKATQSELTKISNTEEKNRVIQELIQGGLSEEQATDRVNKYKVKLETDLDEYKRQYEHIKKQSPYFSGYDFSKSNSSSGSNLPAGVTEVKP